MKLNIENFARKLCFFNELYVDTINEKIYAQFTYTFDGYRYYSCHRWNYDGNGDECIRKTSFDEVISKEYMKKTPFCSYLVPAKEFAKTMSDEKITESLNNVKSDDEYDIVFSDLVVNSDIPLSEEYDAFELNHYKNISINFCIENDIDYTLEHFKLQKRNYDLKIDEQYQMESREKL